LLLLLLLLRNMWVGGDVGLGLGWWGLCADMCPCSMKLRHQSVVLGAHFSLQHQRSFDTLLQS
jgi:hypothetical protein